MLDKRRLYATGSPPCTLLFVFVLVLTGCLSLWFRIGGIYPNPPIGSSVIPESGASYRLLLPLGNDSWNVPMPFSLQELPSSDESTLIDMRDFRFLINHDPCNKSQPLLLMLIHSAPGNFLKREVIRETWGRRKPSVVLLFFIGTSEDFRPQIEEENRRNGDLVQGNFLDVYRNLTYKHVMALKWTAYHCPSARYVLKLDDDVFVHVSGLMEFLTRGLSPQGARRLILCDLLPSGVVKRSWRSKWRVSPREYPGRSYPTYCAGWAILYSPDTVFWLYREAQRQPYFWIDDVHVTGTLARRINVTQLSLHSLVLTPDNMQAILENPNERRDFLFGPPNLSEEAIRALHQLVTNSA